MIMNERVVIRPSSHFLSFVDAGVFPFLRHASVRRADNPPSLEIEFLIAVGAPSYKPQYFRL